MVSIDSIKKYRKVFNTDSCAYNEPGYGEVIITDDEHHVSYIGTWKETDEEFLDRIERSLKAGRNLFLRNGKNLFMKKAGYIKKRGMA